MTLTGKQNEDGSVDLHISLSPEELAEFRDAFGVDEDDGEEDEEEEEEDKDQAKADGGLELAASRAGKQSFCVTCLDRAGHSRGPRFTLKARGIVAAQIKAFFRCNGLSGYGYGLTRGRCR